MIVVLKLVEYYSIETVIWLGEICENEDCIRYFKVNLR